MLLQYMQKKKNVAIYSILVLTIISVIISAIVMYPVPHSLKNSNKNNANIVPVFLRGSHCNKQILLPFRTYQDPIYGIKIQYPSDWEKMQFDRNFIVGFVSSSKRDSGLLPNLMIAVLKSHSPSTSLSDFGNARISTLARRSITVRAISPTRPPRARSRSPIPTGGPRPAIIATRTS